MKHKLKELELLKHNIPFNVQLINGSIYSINNYKNGKFRNYTGHNGFIHYWDIFGVYHNANFPNKDTSAYNIHQIL